MAVTVTVNTCLAFEYIWKLWQFCGFQPPKSGSKWRIPYLVYAVCLNATSALLLPVTLVIKCGSCRDLKELCESLYVFISDVVCNVKYSYVFWKRRHLLRVHTQLQVLDQHALDSDEKDVLLYAIAKVKHWFAVYSCLTAFAFITRPLVIYFSNERALLYPAWFPWNWHEYFYAAYAYQVYGLGVQTIQSVGNDMFPQAYICILTSHIKALGLRIQKLGNHQQQHKWTQHSTVAALAKARRQTYQDLIVCIKDHQRIIEAFSLVDGTISTISIAQFAGTGLALCTMGVHALYGEMNISQMVNTAMFGTVLMLQSFMLCYFGDQLCEESENLTKQIYACNWMDQSMEFRKALLLLLQRSQQLNIIMAGNLFPVELQTFVKIMKAAYSAFTVLNNMK